MYLQVPPSPYLCHYLTLGCSTSVPQWSQIQPVPRGAIKILNAARVSLLSFTPFVLSLHTYLLNTYYTTDPALGPRNMAIIKRESLLCGVHILGREGVEKKISEYILLRLLYQEESRTDVGRLEGPFS